MNKNIVKVITFMAGLYFLLEFILPVQMPGWMGGFKNPFTVCFTQVTNFLLVLGAMGFLLGPINLTREEFLRVVRLRKNWAESVVYLVALVLGIMATVYGRENPAGAFEEAMKAVYDALLFGVNLAFYTTSMALVAFYIVSAAHRAFLLNSVESGLMLVSACIVMLALTPLGDYLNGLMPTAFQFSAVSQWILDGPNIAVQKAVLFGACGGAFAAAMRNWLSLDRNSD